MKIKHLKKMLRYLDPEMEVLVPAGHERAMSACRDNSGVVTVYVEDEAEQPMLMLVPCSCGEEEVEVDYDDLNMN